jgi:hypothetical protein
MARTSLSSLVACMALAASTAYAGKAHEHGVVRLDVSVEGSKLTIDMVAALDNWLGFERAPRNDAERKAAAEVLARLRNPQQGAPLFATDAGAQCQLTLAEVSAPVLEPGAKPAANAGAAPAAPTAAPTSTAKGAEHADLETSYTFQCAQPTQLRNLELGLFDAYKRIQRIHVQVAGPKGQSKVTLRRPARSVALTR